MPTKIELLTEVQRAIHDEEGQIKRLSKAVGLDEDRFAYYFEGLKFCDDLIHEFKQDLIKEKSRDLQNSEA
tara:strand:+ start:201 stop:413 length:213 start_codon:yes stop_codon:yes gene_type:complete